MSMLFTLTAEHVVIAYVIIKIPHAVNTTAMKHCSWEAYCAITAERVVNAYLIIQIPDPVNTTAMKHCSWEEYCAYLFNPQESD